MSILSLAKIEKQNLNCIYDAPELIYKFDIPYFISEIGNDLLETITLLYEEGVSISIDNLVAYGNSANNSITKENLIALRKEPYNIGEFDFYFRNLKAEYAKYQINEHLLDDTLVETTKKGKLNLDKIQDLINCMQDNLDIIEGKESSLQSLDAVAKRYQGVLVDRKHGKYKFTTGDHRLDSQLSVGFAPGQITTIFGATGIGKSMFAINLVNKQINKRIPNMYVSLEMDEISTMDRILAIRQQAPAHLFLPNEEGELSEEAFDLLERETQILLRYNQRFFLVTDPSLTMAQLEVLIKEAKKKMKTPYLICTVDLLTMISDIGQKPQEIEEALNRLHVIAKRQNVHIVSVIQANRQQDSMRIDTFEQLDKLRPKTLHGIKNAGAFAERSRLVFSVFRPKYYAQQFFPDAPETDMMPDVFLVTIIKQSQGKAGSIVKYLYDPECFKLFPYFDADEEIPISTENSEEKEI